MAERLLPSGLLNETGTAERLVAGLGLVNETTAPAGGGIVSYIASGGMVFGGASGLARKGVVGGVGGMVFGGNSQLAIAPPIPIGGIVFDAGAEDSRIVLNSSTGGVVWDGLAAAEASGGSSASAVAAGGMIFGDSAIYTRHTLWEAVGGAGFLGNAGVIVHVSQASAMGSGGMAFVGDAEAGYFSLGSGELRQRTMVGCGI